MLLFKLYLPVGVIVGLAVCQDIQNWNAAPQDVAGAHMFNAQMWAAPQVRFSSDGPVGPDGSQKFDQLPMQMPVPRTSNIQETNNDAPQKEQPQMQYRQLEYADPAYTPFQYQPYQMYYRSDNPSLVQNQNLEGQMSPQISPVGAQYAFTDLQRSDEPEGKIDESDENARTKGKGYSKGGYGKGKGGYGKGHGYGRMADSGIDGNNEENDQMGAYRTKGLKGYGGYQQQSYHDYTPIIVVPQSTYPCSGVGNHYPISSGHYGYGGYAREASTALDGQQNLPNNNNQAYQAPNFRK